MKKIEIILSLLNKREKKQLILVFFAMLITGVLEVVGVGSITPFMSVVTNQDVIISNKYLNLVYSYFNFDSTAAFIFALGVAVIVFLAISNLARAGISFIIRIYSGKRLHSVSMRLLKKYLYQPYVFFLNVNTADLSKNILSEVASYVNRVLIISLQLITNTIICLSIVALLVAVNPAIALGVSIVLGSAYLIIFTFVRRYLGKRGKERAEVNSLKYKYVSEAFGGIKDVKLLGAEDVFLNLFSGPSKKFATNDAISEVVGETPKYILETLAFGGIIGLILFMLGTGKDIDEVLPLITLYAFGGYRLLPALQKVFNAITKIKYSLPIVEVLYKDYHNLPDRMPIEKRSTVIPLSLKNEINLKDIRFSYPETTEPVIKDQSLKIKANTSVAFVGPTGCGKTTMIDIVLGLLEAQEGSVLADDVIINESNKGNWQVNLGYVPQSIYLIDDTITNNIAFGVPADEVDFEAVKLAAETANLHEFIERDLENGYNTVVGERGVRLSGGQRQRIGIARAVYHNPSVLILDEATSALDGLTEQAIMDAIHNLSHKKTIIMIAHRLTTVKECDEIFVMDKGIIKDSGKYSELLERNDDFRRMAEGTK